MSLASDDYQPMHRPQPSTDSWNASAAPEGLPHSRPRRTPQLERRGVGQAPPVSATDAESRAFGDRFGIDSDSSTETSAGYALRVEVGLYAGSFDPVHLGHSAVIATASETLDRLVVIVAANSNKQAGMFSVQERLQMLSEACQPFGNVRVATLSGLLVAIAVQVGATVLVRGAGKEHVDEEQMAYMNGRDGLPTVLIPSDPTTAFISSSQVRTLIRAGALHEAGKLVPAGVTQAVKARETTSLFL